MSLDGIMLAATKNELEHKLVDGRIDKIYQISGDTLTLTVRNHNTNYQLLISANPQHARIHLSKINYENPIKPPDFCMLLRKYILRCIIGKIEQPDFERILIFHLKQRNTKYYLFLEIMGKYSNISLVDEGGIVLDSIRRVTEQQSQERQLYPGIKYRFPPAQDKFNPLVIDKNEFLGKITITPGQSIYRAIMNNFRGIGPDSAREIVYRAGHDYQSSILDLNEKDLSDIWDSFSNYFQKVREGSFRPTIGFKNDKNIDYYSAFELTHKEEIDVKRFDSIGDLFDFYYQNKIKLLKINSFQQRQINIVEKYLSKNQKQSRMFKKDLQQARNADVLKEQGELLKANIYQLKKGMEKLEVINYYDPEQKTITINLDPSLSPTENIQRYFKKYQKAKKSIMHLKKQLGILRHEERYLENVLLNIQQAESVEELAVIEQELKEEGYIRAKKHHPKNKNKQPQPLPPYHFKSSQGYDILVGRNNHQNDYLTQKIANRDDLWFHVKDLAGSHVILRNHTGKEVPPDTLKEAACIAAYYSKGRMSANVPVDYTEIRNVKKPKGAKPGLVYYENYQTIYTTPEEDLVQRLKISK